MKQHRTDIISQRRYPTGLFVSGLVVLWLAVSMISWGCGAQTAGTKMKYEAAFTGAVSSGTNVKEFTNKRGWTIQLESAEFLVGPLYFYAGEPRASLLQSWFGIGSAAACTTHAQFDAGKILGEVQEQVVVNLLSSSPTNLGTVAGVEGQMQSFELHLHPPGTLPSNGTPTSTLGNSTVKMKGVAKKDGVSKTFVVDLVIPDTGTMRIVESIAADVALNSNSKGSGKLLLQVYMDKWFTNVDFSTLTKENKDGVLLLDDENIALLQGVRSRYSYNAKWSQ